MEDIRIVINKSSRLIKSISKRILGNDGENLQENLVFSFEDEFVNGQARLEYVLPDDTGSYLVLTKVDDKYQIPVRSLLLQEGTIHFQLVITEGEDAASIPVFKSNIFKMKITSSLNTVEIEAPAGYASWLELANTKLNQMDNFNISATKSGNTATISVTNRLNQTTSVDVVDGADFQYDWQGTSLGVKNSNEQEYEYVNLKGNTGDKGDKGDKPVKGVDYFTSQDIADMEDYVINSSTSAFNQNATQKTNEFNSNVTSKTESFNTNASSKTSAFDSNATSKMTTFNENATQKTNAFNSNAASKTDDFNTNATTKTTAYNDNAIAKTTAFDENAQDKIDEYDEHVEELTDEIEYLQDQVADLSDNQLINSASGSEIYVNDAARARLNEFKMTKESSQETTTGKNLFDGILRLGNYSNETGGYLENDNYIVNTNYIPVNELTNYIFSLNNEGIKMYVFEYREDYSYNLTARKTVYANTNFTTEQGTKYVNFRTFDSNTDLQAKVQLEQGTTITNYEPYTGGQPSPSPDYPQEVKTVKGYRNLFDGTYSKTFTQGSTPYIYRDNNTSVRSAVVEVKPNTTYTISKELSNRFRISEYNELPVPDVSIATSLIMAGDSNLNYTLNTSSTTKYLAIQVTTENQENVQLQVVEGTEALPYVPYGNNYVNVKVVGKNFLNIFINKSKDFTETKNGITEKFNDDGSITYSGTATAQTDFYITDNTYGSTKDNIILDITKTYTFSLVNNTNANIQILIGYGSTAYNTSTARTFTPAANISYVFVRINNGTNLTTPITIYPMLEEGNTITSYEQYKESIVTIPLNGNEIAGIGDYKDTLIVDKFGKCYLKKKIGKVVLDGTENWADRPNYTFSDRFVLQDTRIPKLFVRSFSNYFIVTNNIEDTLPILILNNGTQITINFSTKGTTTLAEFKEWLSTHNTDVYYVSAQEELIDLNYTIDLKTFKGINHISNSEDADMQIKYVQDINTIISNIQNAILEIGGE